MGSVRKYKYYFRKQKSQIVRDIFTLLVVGGIIAIAATSPYFVQNVLRVQKNWKKYPKQKSIKNKKGARQLFNRRAPFTS